MMALARLAVILIVSQVVQCQRSSRGSQTGFRNKENSAQSSQTSSASSLSGVQYQQQQQEQPQNYEVARGFVPARYASDLSQPHETTHRPSHQVIHQSQTVPVRTAVQQHQHHQQSPISQQYQQQAAQPTYQHSQHLVYPGRTQSLLKDPYTTPIPILRMDKQQSLDGSYKLSYETGNSIMAEETGFMKQTGTKEGDMLVQQGSYSYTDPDGKVVTVHYVADEKGFRAEGDHFPTPPPIPPEIQRGLDMIYQQMRIDAEMKQKGHRLNHEGYYSSSEKIESYRPRVKHIREEIDEDEEEDEEEM